MKTFKLIYLFAAFFLMYSCSDNEDVVTEEALKSFKSRLDRASSEEEVLAISNEYANSNIEVVTEPSTIEEVLEVLGSIEGEYANEKQMLKSIYCSPTITSLSYSARYCGPSKCNNVKHWLDVNLSGSVSVADLVVMTNIINGQSVPNWQKIRAKYPNEINSGCTSANGLNYTCTDREAVATWLLGYHPCTE